MTSREKKRGRPAGNSGVLSESVIIKKSKCLMLESGKIPSIRQLSSSLDVDPMAIYYYFKNKQALLEAVTTSLVDQIYRPEGEESWERELRKLCDSYLKLLARYPGLLEVLLSMQSEGPAEVFARRFDLIVARLNLDKNGYSNALDLLVDYLHGFALAMKCNGQSGALQTEMIEGPLSLYLKALSGPNA